MQWCDPENAVRTVAQHEAFVPHFLYSEESLYVDFPMYLDVSGKERLYFSAKLREVSKLAFSEALKNLGHFRCILFAKFDKFFPLVSPTVSGNYSMYLRGRVQIRPPLSFAFGSKKKSKNSIFLHL